MYQRANNFGVKNPISGRNLLNILRCFVKKVSDVAIFCLLMPFLAHFWTLWYSLAYFLHYLGLLGLLRCFVAKKIFCYSRTHWVKHYWLKPYLCKKKFVFFHVCFLVALNTSNTSMYIKKKFFVTLNLKCIPL